MKLKALQSYQEQKFKRLKNIKSKRYRKILRKEREKNEEKELAKLEKEDPAKFREVLEQMEKKRMMVRTCLSLCTLKVESICEHICRSVSRRECR